MIGLVVVAVLVVMALTKVPATEASSDRPASTRRSLSNLWKNKVYREGVLAQMFYVAAQIMTWTFIIQYADNLGINKARAQTYNIIAMGLFLCGRFIATALMKYVDSRKLLAVFAVGASLCAAGAILVVGMPGLYCLMGISAFMSLMFPTIYGIALENVDRQDASLGAAFLVEAIVGGAIMPPLQGAIIDLGTVWGHPAVNVSFILPLVCFLVVLAYALRARKAVSLQ
jgi:FHS family L-fucose permease-like MFS transporter